MEFIHVTHSVPNCTMLAIQTPVGTVVHTADFKVDPTPVDGALFDLHSLAEYGKRGVLLLLSDSTNSDREGYTLSERAVRPRLEEIFSPRGERPLLLLLLVGDPSHPADSRRGISQRPQGRLRGAQHFRDQRTGS